MIMLCGIGTGYLLRNKKMSFIGRIITALIWVLLFLLGIEVGSNPRIVNGLQTLGLEAIVLTLGGSIGSAIFAWALWRYVTAKQKGKTSVEQAICAVCKAAYGTTKPHTYSDWKEEVSATETEFGTKGHYDCLVCGKHFDEIGNEITDLRIAKTGTYKTTCII